MQISKRTDAAVTLAACAAVVLPFLFSSNPACAINAGDVMDKMEPSERSGFIAGAVDMASHLYAATGNRKKADCAVEWLFVREATLSEIHAFFDQHKDRDAVGLLSIMIDRHCGK